MINYFLKLIFISIVYFSMNDSNEIKKCITKDQTEDRNNPSDFLTFTRTDTIPNPSRNLKADTMTREDSLKKGLRNMIETQPGKTRAFKPHVF